MNLLYNKKALNLNGSGFLNEEGGRIRTGIFAFSILNFSPASSNIIQFSQIVVDTSINEYINDGIYAIKIENALFVKRLQYMPGKLLVKSDNPIYQPFEVDLKTNNVNIIGAVVYVMNDMSCL